MAKNGRKDPNNITMYNVSKRLVTSQGYRDKQVRFKYPEAFDGYAGVKVPSGCFTESPNTDFWHIRMPKELELTMSYKTGIRADQVETKTVSPREFKDMFEKTRLPKKKKDVSSERESAMQSELGDVATPEEAASAEREQWETFPHDMADHLPF